MVRSPLAGSVTHFACRYWCIRKAMRRKGITATSLSDIAAALLAKGVTSLQGSGTTLVEDAPPPTSRFQSALARRIAAANVMWGASDVVDFKVHEEGCRCEEA